MNLNTRQHAIITGALADIERLRRKQPQINAYGQCQDTVEREAIEHAAAGLIRTNPARWLDHDLSGSDYVMLSRDYKAMEAAGLIRRHRLGFSGVSFTHIEITEAGKALAQQLTTPATPATTSEKETV